MIVNKKLMKKILIIIVFFQALTNGYIVGLFERDFINLPGHKVAQAQSLYVDIGHRFITPLDREGNFDAVYKDFLGADGSGNITMNAAYGVGNLFDIKFSRYRITKLYLISTRFNLMNQPIDRLPISLSLEANFGMRTVDKPANPKFKRETYGGALVIGRDFLKEQLFLTGVLGYQEGTPGENDVLNENPNTNTLSVGTNFGIRLDRWTVAFEYIRPLTGYLREVDAVILDNFGMGLRYRIYKHSFGITLNNHAINSTPDILAGASNHTQSKYNMRFGFNITRQIGGY